MTQIFFMRCPVCYSDDTDWVGINGDRRMYECYDCDHEWEVEIIYDFEKEKIKSPDD